MARAVDESPEPGRGILRGNEQPVRRDRLRGLLVRGGLGEVFGALVLLGRFLGVAEGAEEARGAVCRADAAESSAEQDSGRPAVTPEAPGAGAASDAGADSDAGSGTDDEASLGNSQSFVGTWTGELKEVSTPYGNCFGASTHPLKITIKSINSSTGQMKADVEVLFHGHDTIDDDADTVDGDRVVTFEDLTGTFEGDGDFRLKGNIDADDEYVVIEAEAEEYSYGVRLEVAVESWSPDMFYTKQIQVDSYDLSKA